MDSKQIGAEDPLFSICQDGRALEQYVEEFIELVHFVPWSDGTLKTLFWIGLDDYLFYQVPTPLPHVPSFSI